MNTKSLQCKFNLKWERKHFFIMLLLAFTLGAKANFVDMKTANKVAQSFLNAKMGDCQKIDLVAFAEKASFSNFYVFGNDHCFVIIAADDCVHPILGYSVENAFGTEMMPENVLGWLKAYNEDIALAVTSKMNPTSDIRDEWKELLNGQGLTPKTRTSVAPLVRTTWNQTAPYNNLCPADPANDSSWYNGHVPTGCMATAMAQILNYWEHPVRGVGSHSYIPAKHPEYGEQYADFSSTVYDWDNMKNSYSDGYTEEEAYAVATLMYHCGVSIDMNYTPTGSSGGYSTEAFKTYFNYNPDMYSVSKSYIMNGNVYDFYSNEEWITMLKNELDLNRPLCYLCGHYVSDEENGNHAFVCDGYDENNYFHFNWGWGGGSDGYYAIGALNTGSEVSQNYNQYNAFFCNCFPITPSIEPPINVFTNVSGRSVNIQWNCVDGATSYKLYRDCDLVANNLTTQSYTDSNLIYGTYSYYVKSVAADGTMSLMSDIATAEVYFSGPVPSNLQANVNNQNVNLSWTNPASNSFVLSYGEGPFVSQTGYGGNYNMWWAQRYSAQILADNVSGMAINKISVYSHRNDNAVTAFIYKGNANAPEELMFETSLTLDNSGWQDIAVTPPVPIDYFNDLWVVMYADTTNAAPAAYCNYSGPGLEDALYISLNGSYFWRWNEERSWMIKTYVTDGTYTYNLYRNHIKIADEISETCYQDNNLPDDHYSYYVTTNYYSGESDASNEVEVLVGNPQYMVSASANPSIGGSVSGGGAFGYGQTCTLTASADMNYIFLNWTEDGVEVSSDAVYGFPVVSNRDLKANFALQYNTISASTSGGGTISGGGTYEYGQACTLSAISNNGYVFTNWTKNGEIVSTDADYTFLVTEEAVFAANFTNAPSGKLNGLFSVGDSKQVRFSQGNLQYQASTNTWRFADHQWGFVGIHNTNISSSYSGWIDLFGWGTSGIDHGAVCYQPWSTSTENSDYFAYNSHSLNLYDGTGQADWGVNPIVNGGNTPNRWRTLTAQEWDYLFNNRPGIRYAKAIVNEKCGVVLLPDGWNESVHVLNYPNEGDKPYTSNVITDEDWAVMETAGAVFLPAGAVRKGNNVTHVGYYTGYWSSSCYAYNNNCASCVHIYTDYINANSFHYRNNGYAVRLVSDYSDITQTTILSQGWNWFSANVEITMDDLKEALQASYPSASTSALIIKSKSDGQTMWNGTAQMWTGSLNAIDLSQMYMVKVPTNGEIILQGMPINPSDHPVTIKNGANWIVFPLSESMSVADAFAGFPANGDIIKTKNDGQAIWNSNASQWMGSLTTLEPGKGYIYNSKATVNKTFTFPINTK